MSDDIVIGQIQKTSTQDLRVALGTYKGRKFLDLRLYIPGDAVERVPTKKGVTIPISKIAELRTLLEKAELQVLTST